MKNKRERIRVMTGYQFIRKDTQREKRKNRNQNKYKYIKEDTNPYEAGLYYQLFLSLASQRLEQREREKKEQKIEQNQRTREEKKTEINDKKRENSKNDKMQLNMNWSGTQIIITAETFMGMQCDNRCERNEETSL